MSEESITITWREGPPPEELLEELYFEWAPYVLTIALRILGHEEDARDVMQDVFMRFFKNRSKIYGPQSVKYWLQRTTVRRARRVLQKKRVRRFAGLGIAPGDLDVPSPGASPEQVVLLGAVFEALESFPVEERLAWT
ncbi:MAG: sigma-70 family RNA polymerase sigma factor, partial [Myxococcota bacterium]